jgi:cytochrome c-type biogenesis protein
MDPTSLTLPIAFLAGLLSFASPCVLPLVPAYLGYLGSTAVAPGDQQAKALSPFVHALLFVLGFSAVFIILGASATLLGRLLLGYSFLLRRVGGVLLVIFGTKLIGTQWQGRRQWWLALAVVAGLITLLLSSHDPLPRLEEGLLMVAVVLCGAGFSLAIQVGLACAAGLLNFLSSYDALLPNIIASLLIATIVFFFGRSDLFYVEKRLELNQGRHESKESGYLRSLLVGVIFAAGWTPCIGPILASILVLASTLQTVGQGILLLAVYSLGLGIPFLLAGLAFAPLSQVLRRANRYAGVISVISGMLLVLMGILIFSDSLAFLAQYSDFINLEP